MTGFPVQARDLSVRFDETTALDRVTFELAAGGIHGLLGRNGSGKTTLLSTIAALRQPSSGSVLVDGEDPFENERVMEGTCIIRESGDVMADEKVSTNLEYFSGARPTWDGDYAEELLDAFGLDRRGKIAAFSRGQKSAFGAVIGLASRAPLTIFDEVYLGMDAPSRQRFYDLLLADYVEHPRTIILSSHLIAEVEQLFESVLVLDAGRVLLSQDADSLRAKGVTVTGPAEDVEAATAGLAIIGRRDLGRTRQVTVFGDLAGADVQRLRSAGLDLGAVSMQDLFIHLTQEQPS